MGSRKHNSAEQRKEAKKSLFFAKLNDCPSSPRKMRLVADLVNGKNVETAVHILQHTPNYAAEKLGKLLKSALSNWQQKNDDARMEDSNLFIQEVKVDEGRSLKRVQPAPQGRAHRIKKRSNHVTVIIASRVKKEETEIVTK